MHDFQYLVDRLPVVPVGLVVGDRILAVHTVHGEAHADDVEQVDITVLTVRADLVEPGHYTVTVGYLDGGEMAHREFDDPGQWLMVAARRLTPPAPLAERSEVAA